jgi:hypothetical protein
VKPLFVLAVLAAVLVAQVALGSAGGAGAVVHFGVVARTGIRLTDVVWTGHRFLFVENTTNVLSAAGPTGTPLHRFASLPPMSEETRCVVSPGGHGFPAGLIYCHAPDNRIYRLGPDGHPVTVFATLPNRSQSDGALTFDTVGRFGYRLLTATGRSGHATPAGGIVYSISADGRVKRIGAYPGPGGSDEIAIAPRGFGTAAGSALVAPDAGGSGGAIFSLSPRGQARLLTTLPSGPNPIAAIPTTSRTDRRLDGLYVADTNTRMVYFARAAQFAAYRGDVIVGSELGAQFWILAMKRNQLVIHKLATDLPPANYNLEGATYVHH